MQTVTFSSPLGDVLERSQVQKIEKAFGYETVGQLLRHYPRRYEPRGALTPILSLPIGEHVTVIAEVLQVVERRMHQRRGLITEATLTDGHGEMKLTWFNQRQIARLLKPGQQGLFAGKTTLYRGSMQLAHPEFKLFDDDEAFPPDLENQAKKASEWQSEIVPIYPATAKLSSWDIREAIKKVLKHLAQVDDPLPLAVRQRAYAHLAQMERAGAPVTEIPQVNSAAFGVATGSASALDEPRAILELTTALHLLHQPSQTLEYEQARESLIFREAFELQLGMLDRKRRAGEQESHRWPLRPGGVRDTFDEALPFTLTDDQRKVGQTLERELAQPHPMHRLLQGEVASGKTLVALRAMLQVADSEGQSALLAPTEVLASQHFRSITETLGPELTKMLNPTLLTGQLPTAVKRRALLDIVTGTARIVVGTHALLSDTTEFENLGFIVIDEQHRFGVEQRETLRRKGKRPPHVLVMTATPIPRTIALTAFGDLDVSTLKQLPQGRAGIVSHVVPIDEHPAWEQRAWDRAAEEIAKGRQVYVVCPAISPNEKEENARFTSVIQGSWYENDTPEVDDRFENVEDTMIELTRVPSLHGARIAALTGAMPSEEKDAVMLAFAQGDIDLLVATTVIEVGVNVPNASMMIIRDAQRFGVSQLHQLRGRVGRGEHAGLCLLITPAPRQSAARERVEAVAATNDGFELADFDLETRREGDLLGSKQSGTSSGLILLRVSEHGDIIELAHDIATHLLTHDPELDTVPLLAEVVRKVRETDLENLRKS